MEMLISNFSSEWTATDTRQQLTAQTDTQRFEAWRQAYHLLGNMSTSAGSSPAPVSIQVKTQDYTAPARQHELDRLYRSYRSYRSGNGAALKDLHHNNGIDYLSEVLNICTRMNLRNRKKNCCCYSRPSLVTSVFLLVSYLLKFVLLHSWGVTFLYSNKLSIQQQ